MMPTDEQMPAAIAELMGWKQSGSYWCRKGASDFCVEDPCYQSDPERWSPMTDRNHSVIALKRCVELGIHVETFIDPAMETRQAYQKLLQHSIDKTQR